MLRRVALVRTDVLEELSASFCRVTGIGELGTTLAATSNRRTLRSNTTVLLRSVRCLLVTASVVPSSPIHVTLMKEALSSSESSFLTKATRRTIPEDTILLCPSFHQVNEERTDRMLKHNIIYIFIDAISLDSRKYCQPFLRCG
jgi:hypothetical protein